VFDIQGNEKPSARVLGLLSSPLELLNVPWNTGHQFEVVVIGSAGLPSYPCKGYTLYWSAPGSDFRKAGKGIPLPEILANETVHVPLDGFTGDAVTATLVRPSGDVVQQRTFSLNGK
jgi:hypothetical protein